MIQRVFAAFGFLGVIALWQCNLFFDLGVLDRGTRDIDSGDIDAVADASSIDAQAKPEEGGDAATDADSAEDGETGGLDGTVDIPSDAGMFDAADADQDSAGIGSPADGGPFTWGLMAYYPFAEPSGATSADVSGHGRAATMQGATFTAGLNDNAATMNGSTQYVSLPTGIVNGLTAFSISTWVNLTTALTHTHIFDFGSGVNVYMFLTPHSGSSTLQFAITTSGVAGEQVLNAARLGIGTWQHVCVTLVGPTATLYVNGIAVAQNNAMTLTPTSLGSTTQNWLGRSQFAADPYVNGKIDEFRIYDRALSAADVQLLFRQRM